MLDPMHRYSPDTHDDELLFILIFVPAIHDVIELRKLLSLLNSFIGTVGDYSPNVLFFSINVDEDCEVIAVYHRLILVVFHLGELRADASHCY